MLIILKSILHFYLWKVYVFYFCEDYNLYVAYFNTTAPEWTEGALTQ